MRFAGAGCTFRGRILTGLDGILVGSDRRMEVKFAFRLGGVHVSWQDPDGIGQDPGGILSANANEMQVKFDDLLLLLLLLLHRYVIHRCVIHRHVIHRDVTHGYVIHKYVIHRYLIHRYVTHRYAIHRYGIQRYVIHRYVIHRYVIHRYVIHRYVMHRYVRGCLGGGREGGYHRVPTVILDEYGLVALSRSLPLGDRQWPSERAA